MGNLGQGGKVGSSPGTGTRDAQEILSSGKGFRMNNLGLNYGGFLENDFLFSPNIGQNMENRWLRWGKWN